MGIENNIGIYIVISPVNKVYVGQSVNISNRLTRYKNMSVKTKKQTKLWRSLLKHGANNHTYKIIELCIESDLNKRERFYQEKYDSVNSGLNCVYTKTKDKSGKVCEETRLKMSEVQKKYLSENKHPFKGKKHTEETKALLSKIRIGKKLSEETRRKIGRKGSTPPLKGKFGKDNPISKKISQYNLNGDLIKNWDCGLDIKRELGFNNTNISSCCNGKLKSSNGYVWRFTDSDKDIF